MILGLDIGGANLKAACGDWNGSRRFELWREPENLSRAIMDLICGQDWRIAAVTMTGELADCYETKTHGVDQILAAVESIADNRPVVVWQTAGEFVAPAVAREFWTLTASANWHALATFASRVASAGVLLDIGSTTTDIVPLRGGVVAEGLTDFERLHSGELLYEGGSRTPVAMLAPHLTPEQVADLPLPRPVAEVFATIADAWQLTLPDIDFGDVATCDGRPLSVATARQRLARQFLCDAAELPAESLDAFGERLTQDQIERIAIAVIAVRRRLREADVTLITSGSSTPLLDAVADRVADVFTERVDLAGLFGAEASGAACAVAVAKLASERVHLISDFR